MKRALIILAAALGFAAHAQDRYPSKPITMIIPLSSGTAADIIARLVADKLGARLGQSVVVQNRPGAGGTIGTEQAARAPADGYTIISVNSQHAINPFAIEKLAYDSLRDFAGIALLGEAPALVGVLPQLGFKSLKDFVAAAKAKPGTIHYGSAGIGTATHLAGALFEQRAGIQLVHVPYKTGNELLQDMLGGRIESTFSPVAFLLSNVRAGKIQPLAISSREPIRQPIEAPTIEEAGGYPGYASSTWYGFLAPAKVPRAIMEQLAHEMKAVAEDKDLHERFAAQGLLPRAILLEEFDKYIRADMDKVGPIMRASKKAGS